MAATSLKFTAKAFPPNSSGVVAARRKCTPSVSRSAVNTNDSPAPVGSTAQSSPIPSKPLRGRSAHSVRMASMNPNSVIVSGLFLTKISSLAFCRARVSNNPTPEWRWKQPIRTETTRTLRTGRSDVLAEWGINNPFPRPGIPARLGNGSFKSACASSYTSPEKPMNAMARIPAVTSAMGMPLNALGTSSKSNRSRIPAKSTSASAKPKAVATE